MSSEQFLPTGWVDEAEKSLNVVFDRRTFGVGHVRHVSANDSAGTS